MVVSLSLLHLPEPPPSPNVRRKNNFVDSTLDGQKLTDSLRFPRNQRAPYNNFAHFFSAGFLSSIQYHPFPIFFLP